MEITGRTRSASARETCTKPLVALLSRWGFVLALSDLIALSAVAILERTTHSWLLVIFILMIPVLFASAGLYSHRLRVVTLDQAPLAVGVITLAATSVVTINFMVLNLPLHPAQVLGMWAAAVVLLPLARACAAPIQRQIVKTAPKQKALVVGSGHSAVLVADKIEHHPELGLEVVGFVDDGPRKSVRGRHEPLLGDLSQLTSTIAKCDVHVVVVAFVKNHYQEILKALYQVEPRVDVLMMPRYFEYLSAGVHVDDLAGMPILGMRQKRQTLLGAAFKRAEDIVLGSVALVIVAPFIPLVALAIKLDSPGPILYKGVRVGKDFKPFTVYKFRSMTNGADRDSSVHDKPREASRRSVKPAENPRVTRLGRILRRTSIDELPQLINVLKGDMSLVGPRPPLPDEVSQYHEWQRKRLSVRPGITGIWQVSGRSELPFDERVWLDFMYIDSWSLWLDFRLLLQTVTAVISMRGAY